MEGYCAIDWSKLTFDEMVVIHNIARRASALLHGSTLFYNMDVLLCHIYCPLDLNAFLASDNAIFALEVTRIGENLERSTGKLKNCFVPKFSEQFSGSISK